MHTYVWSVHDFFYCINDMLGLFWWYKYNSFQYNDNL